MNKVMFLIIMLTIALSTVWADTDAAAAPTVSSDTRVMICNASTGDIFIRLSDEYDVTVMETEDIPQYAVSRMFTTSQTGLFYLSYKENEADDWEYYAAADNEDEDYQVELIAGKVCCIVLDDQGGVYVNQLSYEDNNQPKICFINMTPGKLNRMEIGTEFATKFEAFTTDLETLDMTNFVTISVGDYGMFWETPEKAAKKQHLFYPNDDGTLYLHHFTFDQWYIFTAYALDDGDHANLYEVGPK